MAAPTDFLRLYQELGLAPGASVDDLRQAYRRRVAELHPDRKGVSYSATVPGAAERLQQLTALYNAASLFHRQHGRLPGASAPPRPPAYERAPNTTQTSEPARTSRIVWLLAVLLAILLIWFAWSPPVIESNGETDESGDAAPAADPAPPMPAAAVPAMPPAHVPALKLGMHDDEVLAIEGQPVSRSGGHWDYGPSWIEFDTDRNKVTDWYSSPLRPLRNASRHPPPPPSAKAEFEP